MCEYENDKLAISNLKEEKIWLLFRRRETNEGKKEEFRCNQMRLRGTQCATAVMLFYYQDRLNVGRFETGRDNTCNNIESNRKNGMNTQTKKSIDGYLCQGKVTTP
jgi:hypothetical protein